MSVNLDYLNPALLPLEEKVKEYLQAEENLQKATIAARTHQLPTPAAAQDTAFDQRPVTGSFNQQGNEDQARLENIRTDLERLHQEIMALLPVRDEWVKVNLGYGPSRVGAFRDEGATTDSYMLRIVM